MVLTKTLEKYIVPGNVTVCMAHCDQERWGPCINREVWGAVWTQYGTLSVVC